MRTPGILLVLAAVVVAGCGLAAVFGPQGGLYPGGCANLGFAPRQCAAMVGRVATWSGGNMVDADTIEVLPPTDDGATHIGGYMISRVRSHPATGPGQTLEIWCIGVAGNGDDACIHDPIIAIAARGLDHDTPCTGDGDPPTGCATPVPTPRPEIQAQARPLRVPALDIPLDHVGPYRIELGEAGLPDGAFTNSTASVVDERPTTFWIRNGDLLIEPVDPKRPPVGSVFREPFDGVERVRVSLVFDVTEVSPGAVLQVRDIVVE